MTTRLGCWESCSLRFAGQPKGLSLRGYLSTLAVLSGFCSTCLQVWFMPGQARANGKGGLCRRPRAFELWLTIFPLPLP